MRKRLLLTAAILSGLLPIGQALAQAPERGGSQRPAFTAADAAAFTNARIAALKAGLELTPAQEKLWPAFETALRDIAKARAARIAAWREKSEESRGKRDVIAALQGAGKALTARGAELEKLAEAAKPLYESLDESQKRRFGILLHATRRPLPGGHHMGPASGPQQEGDDDDKD